MYLWSVSGENVVWFYESCFRKLVYELSIFILALWSLIDEFLLIFAFNSEYEWNFQIVVKVFVQFTKQYIHTKAQITPSGAADVWIE